MSSLITSSLLHAIFVSPHMKTAKNWYRLEINKSVLVLTFQLVALRIVRNCKFYATRPFSFDTSIIVKILHLYQNIHLGHMYINIHKEKRNMVFGILIVCSKSNFQHPVNSILSRCM